MNPKSSTTSGEVSTSKVAAPLLHFERSEEQIGDIHVLQIVDDTVDVVQSLPHERLQQRTVDPEQIVAEETTRNIVNKEVPQERLPERIKEQIAGIPFPPTVEEIVESVQIVLERVQQSIEEQIVDAPVPQIVEEQLVAVAPTPATTDATFPHETFDEACRILALKQAEVRQAELVVQRLDLYVAITSQACDAEAASKAWQAYESATSVPFVSRQKGEE